ncbi:UDP-N-acetylglucosamine 2-epimerase [bacterium]|nr:UDP-N-acetylglucosamine 2-epimerase [bacterium]
MINHNLRLIDPIGYLDFLRLMISWQMAFTDSGSIQEETTYLGIPCFTLRANSECPITVEKGTNTLVGQDMESLTSRFNALLDGDTAWDSRPPEGIPLSEGYAANRIVNILKTWGNRP